MCGIFGIINYSKEKLTTWKIEELQEMINNLFDESEMRGKDASGICILSESLITSTEGQYLADRSASLINEISIFKDHIKGSNFKNYKQFENIVGHINTIEKFKSLLGHTRAQTKGNSRFNINNHPIIANKTIGIHNGIIGNDDLLFAKYKSKIVREGQVDSEIIFRLIDMYIANGKDIENAVKETTNQILGSYACAFINLDWPNYLTLFKGSTFPNIVIYVYELDKLIVFASSSIILSNAIKGLDILDEGSVSEKLELEDRKGVRINISDGKMYVFNTKEKEMSVNSGINSGPCIECQFRNCYECPHFSIDE